jgi:hypothetical protein
MTGLMAGGGTVIAGEPGGGVGSVLAGVILAGMASSGSFFGSNSRKIFTGLVTGMALSAALAFSTASIPGYSIPHPQPAEKAATPPAPINPAP